LLQAIGLGTQADTYVNFGRRALLFSKSGQQSQKPKAAFGASARYE